MIMIRGLSGIGGLSLDLGVMASWRSAVDIAGSKLLWSSTQLQALQANNKEDRGEGWREEGCLAIPIQAHGAD